MQRIFTLIAATMLSNLLCSLATAEVRLPGFYGDHMVLQQEHAIRVWGWAGDGEKVTVAIGEHSASTTTGADGKWKVELPPMKASDQPNTLVVAGKNRIELKDILIGEVWLCSGQSNMEWSVRSSSNAKEEIQAANHPMIRHMKVARTSSMTPVEDIKSEWQICSPQTAGNFTACGYFMARHLQKELGVPIGLVNSSWGGTRVEPWTPPVGFQKVDALADIYQSVLGRTPGTPQYEKSLTQHIQKTEAWLAEARDSLAKQKTTPPSPPFPASLDPFKSHQDPTMLYNAMIHSLVGFPIRGAIWYQGESNHNEGMLYFEKKKALINGWRELWGQGDFPFYYVQIAPFQYGAEDPAILAKFWEAQAAVQQVKNTGMVVINDIATVSNIHPPNKQDVGHRLALLALKNEYGHDVIARSPEFDSMKITDGKLVLTFQNTGGGLKTRDGKAPTHFEIVGPGTNGFHPADATIDVETVTLSSKKVPNPVAFRFAWHKTAEPNLMGGTGLPVGAVRGGTEPDFASALSIEKDYKLVYDMDLGKLQKDIKYDVNNSGSITSFERIGYLLELESDSGKQGVFVSMPAFTDDVTKIAIPTLASKAHFQESIGPMEVFSSVESVKTGSDINGHIEFWSNNYSAANSARVKGASNSEYDFGDSPAQGSDGYGSMQIHDLGSKQTIFAINNWSAGPNADIGIGNGRTGFRDWTFSGNAKSYSKKRLTVYVQ